MHISDSTRFHSAFDDLSRTMIEKVREDLLESVEVPTREQFIAQLLMNEMFAHPLDAEAADYDKVFRGLLTSDSKFALVRIAEHMGPDWAQALYHAAVFITKVA